MEGGAARIFRMVPCSIKFTMRVDTMYVGRAMPGYGLTLGYTLSYLGLVVLIPLAGVFFKTSELGLAGLFST